MTTEKKPQVKRKPKTPDVKKEKPAAVSQPLSQLYYEIDTVRFMMEMFSDADLFDYCAPHIEMYKHKELDKYYDKLIIGEKLTPEERKKLEAFCILVNVDLFLVV